MPKIQKKTAKRAESDWQTEVFLFGYCTRANGTKDFRRGKGLMFGETPMPPWSEVEAELLPDWIEEHPCTRPWAWWLVMDREMRLRVGGSGEFSPNRYSTEFGLPIQNTWWKKINLADPPTFESQAAYLSRLELLTPAEKAWLSDHPEARNPVKIGYLTYDMGGKMVVVKAPEAR